MDKTPTVPRSEQGPNQSDANVDPKEQQALDESRQPSVSRPGGFKNDPDDPTNPNEAIERSRRNLRQ